MTATATATATANGERRVGLPTGSAYVVPRGQQHRPSAPAGASLRFEPTGTLSTGDHAGALPEHVDATTGRALG